VTSPIDQTIQVARGSRTLGSGKGFDVKLAVRLALVLAVAAASFATGARWARQDGPSDAASRAAFQYACPMHPQYRADRASDCPSCGMRLEPVDAAAPASADEAAASIPAGALRISPDRQQTIGVRLGLAERVAGRRTLRTTGRVAANENAVYPLVAGAEGLVREMRGATTGSLVRKNEVLLSFYSPDFVNAQQSYFAGLQTLERPSNAQLQGYDATRVADGVERFANTLRNLGVSEQQLAEMKARRSFSQYIQVVSPVDGFVLERKAALGLRCDRGFEFYRVADLRRVWVLADVYESQARFIRPGTRAALVGQDMPRVMDAAVSDAEPTFDETTRTLKVRLETDNPGFALKPGMFVDVEFDLDLPATLVVPADAIVDTGLRKTLFVDRGNGFFEPRQVETGWRLGDQVEVVRGLMAGERIVISGTFLIDSESRMISAASGFGAPARDPVCGMDVDGARAAAAGLSSVHEGATYFFCAEECKKSFDADPARRRAR
jgi:Cu(I)/Ag(I) efflux system membrane fusion protein